MRIITTFVVAVLLAVGATSCKSCSLRNGQMVPGEHTAQNSLDWAGIYRGVLPAADADGIETVVVLNPDHTFIYYTKHLGAGNRAVQEARGNFTWKKDGKTIVFNDVDGGDALFQVRENAIVRLDKRGRVVKGDLAEHYVLAKTGLQLDGIYWRLKELNGEKVVIDDESIREPHLVFSAKDVWVTGNAGCNTINGPYIAEGDRLTFGVLMSTLMACPNQDLETNFMQMLEAVTNYSLDGGMLTFKDAEGNALSVFEPVHLF